MRALVAALFVALLLALACGKYGPPVRAQEQVAKPIVEPPVAVEPQPESPPEDEP